MRTENDICLICGINKSRQTNSHFLPVGLLKTNTGKRDYENIFVIGLGNESLSEFKGRSNLSNDNTEIKPNPHAADYIFCTECESKLSILESKYIPFLNSIDNTKFKVVPDNNVVEFSEVDILEFKIFIYSIIFRLNLQSIIKNNISGIDIRIHHQLRDSIKNYFGKLEYLVDLSIDFLLFTTLDKKYEATGNYVGINNEFIVPLIMANEFHVLPVTDTYPLLNSKYADKFNHYLNALVVTSKTAKIGIIPIEKWIETNLIFTEYEAYMFKLPKIVNLMNKTKKSFESCENLLLKLGQELMAKTGKKFGYCFEEAYKQLMSE